MQPTTPVCPLARRIAPPLARRPCCRLASSLTHPESTSILRLSQQSVAMERVGPLPGEPVAECERKARESDVLLCIVAHRYGRSSITRREVEAAREAGKDVLVWIVADDYAWPEKKESDLLNDPP